MELVTVEGPIRRTIEGGEGMRADKKISKEMEAPTR
jgi:hypothetical protein